MPRSPSSSSPPSPSSPPPLSLLISPPPSAHSSPFFVIHHLSILPPDLRPVPIFAHLEIPFRVLLACHRNSCLSLACLLACGLHALARSLACSLARLLVRSLALARSLARSLSPSVPPSLPPCPSLPPPRFNPFLSSYYSLEYSCVLYGTYLVTSRSRSPFRLLSICLFGVLAFIFKRFYGLFANPFSSPLLHSFRGSMICSHAPPAISSQPPPRRFWEAVLQPASLAPTALRACADRAFPTQESTSSPTGQSALHRHPTAALRAFTAIATNWFLIVF